MAELQLIVERLNAEPFNKGLSLVTFDEKSPQELLQTLNDVCAGLDSAHEVDVRDEATELTGARLMQFLSVLKYNLPPDTEGFKAAMMAGDRGAIYPVLHYLLSQFPKLKKRAYLAKYLVNVEVPAEYMHDEATQEVYQQYKALQEEFKEVHKVADRLKGSTLSPSDLKREISQLTEERQQLSEKIKNLQRKTATVEGFKPLLEATSALRREQEEETKLQERMHEQRMALSAADRRVAESHRRLSEMRSSAKDDVSPESMLTAARKENEQNREVAMAVLPDTLRSRQETLDSLRRALMEPAKTEEDMFQLRSEVSTLESTIDRLQADIAEATRAQGDDKLALFRQQYAIITKKLQQQEAEVEMALEEADKLGRDIQAKEAKMSELGGAKFMKRDEFKAYASQLRIKTNQFKSMKAELAALNQELVVLSRTEHILKARDHNVEEFMAKLEAKEGVEGYTRTQAELAKLSELKATVDDVKGRTLNEISRIVTDINHALKERKNKLAPQIKELRAVRLQYQELESSYLMAKGTYESTAAGLEAERSKLEQEANALQDDALREESRYHYLQSMSTVLKSHADRVRDEAGYLRGEGRLLRDFESWGKLYESKLSQQQQLSNQLRRQQKDIKENADTNMKQRTMFVDLRKLLTLKVKLYREDSSGGGESKTAEGAGFASFDEIGGANVMTLGQ